MKTFKINLLRIISVIMIFCFVGCNNVTKDNISSVLTSEDIDIFEDINSNVDIEIEINENTSSQVSEPSNEINTNSTESESDKINHISSNVPEEPERPEKVTRLYSFDINISIDEPLKDIFHDSKNGNSLPYSLYVPKNYSPSKKYPVILFLHGAGEIGTDNYTHLNNIENMFNCNADYISQAILLCPQSPEWWSLDYSEYGDQSGTLGSALHLLQEIQNTYSCDENRIYVTGLSMGGHATWELLEHYGDIFAAGVPICGFGNSSNGTAFKDIPIRIYHGTADPTVSFSQSKEMYNSIIGVGGTMVELFPLAGVGHNAWKYAYADRDLFAWLFAQNKSNDTMAEYSHIDCFEILDSNENIIISDKDIIAIDHTYYISGSKADSVDIKIQLSEDGKTKLEKAYTQSEGKEFTVYCSSQKIYSFTATKPPIDNFFLITGVFKDTNYIGFYDTIKLICYNNN